MNCFTKSKSVEIVTKSWLNIKQIITEDGNAIVMSCDPKKYMKTMRSNENVSQSYVPFTTLMLFYYSLFRSLLQVLVIFSLIKRDILFNFDMQV